MPTNTDTSLYKQCSDGIVAVVQGLNLTGLMPGGAVLPAAQVYQRLLLPVDFNNHPLPGVFVTLAPLAEALTGPYLTTTTGTDDVAYPHAITLVTAKNQDLSIDDAVLLCRQQLAGAFHLRRPAELAAACSLFQMSYWEPGTVLDFPMFLGANVWASTMVVRTVVRKGRP